MKMNPERFIFLVWLALLWTTSGAPAAISDDEDLSIGATKVSWDFTRWCDVGSHHFVLEKTTLADVIRTFGAGTMTKTGTSGAAVFDWVVNYRHKNEVVTFMSNNDMGGPEHDLGEIEIQPATKLQGAANFPEIKGPIKTSFAKDVMSFTDLQHTLGKAKILEGNRAKYEYSGHIKLPYYSGQLVNFDVTGWLEMEVSNQKICDLDFGRVTSY
jgi:hypothetical protein